MAVAPNEQASDLALPRALAAFLQGVERRGAVLAELQAGEPGIGDAALTRAMAGFRDRALAVPMHEWDRVFWSELLAQPALRRASRAQVPAFMPRCSPALRAALLLKLAAGLDEATAAAVLDVAPGSYRRAVMRALPCAADGMPEPATWARLQGEVQRRIRDLPTDRSLRLVRMREAALSGPASRFFAGRRVERPQLVRLGAVAGLAGALLVATVVVQRSHHDAGIEQVPLAAAGNPAARYGDEAALIAHPDFAILADPAGEQLARQAAFLSWVVGRAAAGPAADWSDDERPAPLVPAPPQETTDAP